MTNAQRSTFGLIGIDCIRASHRDSLSNHKYASSGAGTSRLPRAKGTGHLTRCEPTDPPIDRVKNSDGFSLWRDGHLFVPSKRGNNVAHSVWYFEKRTAADLAVTRYIIARRVGNARGGCFFRTASATSLPVRKPVS